MALRVTIWNEFRHEKTSEKAKSIYPEGIHSYIKSFVESDDVVVTLAALDDPEQGISDELLNNTDVLLWWGHMAHREVNDDLVCRIRERVYNGMGFIPLHSGHHSKPFKLLMGTTCHLTWREDGDYALVWAVKPSHPIAAGIDRYFKLEHEETYGEPFDIPEPDETVFISSYEGGEVFRCGCCFYRGNGRIFYFQPGHETYPTYHQSEVQKVIKHAVLWAKPTYRAPKVCPRVEKPKI